MGRHRRRASWDVPIEERLRPAPWWVGWTALAVLLTAAAFCAWIGWRTP